MIAAKRGKELLAPYLYEQTTTSEWFNQWLEHSLIKELKKGTTVIMDNAAFHKKDSIQKILKKHGHKALFLPPYSPDFNPIEQDFAVMKKKIIYGGYKDLDELTDKQLEYAANDVIYLHKIKNELEKMLVREKRMDLYKRCINFLDTRIELDQTGFKFDVFEH